MSRFEQLQGALFDLDGVITDTARLHARAWQAVATQVGADWTPALADSLKGIDRMSSLELILRAAGKQDAYSATEKQALATAKNERYLALVDTLTPADILPGIEAFVGELKNHGFRIALASASKNAPKVLARLGLAADFPHIVDPATLHHGKPDPEIFTRAAASIQLPAAACFGVEDAAAGVTAIRRSGALAVGIGDPAVLGDADLVFASTGDLTLTALQQRLAGDAHA
ncbi:beta-phosphoglucomutase [Lacticaseibacillus nasuensis]|uniref:beta-phosphoglucomutase n=1 Tax=Lacticaseibacillus nasuensis TaxID=944671 RepID=UPI0022467CAD|nr:beta-phosphoglucomutase [Lacticaseibacillus nasuensis]MCX2455399.1 beta-phosphoglucomutase [Lacticaseibacillus nasuensis]